MLPHNFEKRWVGDKEVDIIQIFASQFAVQEEIFQNCHPRVIEEYKGSYERWQKGQEMPLEGFPLKHWEALPPAVRDTLIALNIRTAEELANAPDVSLHKVMDGFVWKKRAAALLETVKTNKADQRMTDLEESNKALKEQLAEAVALLREQGEKCGPGRPKTKTADTLVMDQTTAAAE